MQWRSLRGWEGRWCFWHTLRIGESLKGACSEDEFLNRLVELEHDAGRVCDSVWSHMNGAYPQERRQQ